MKKLTLLLLIVCMLFSAAGCSALNDVADLISPTEEVFSIEGYRLQITADSTFKTNTGGNFDLQITNGKAYISIMAYKYIDLPEDTTPQDVYDVQNEDLFSKRTNVTAIEESETQALHSAEKDGVKNYYATYLIDLPDAETFAWVLVTATPSYFENNKEYLNNIVYSLTTIE